MSRRAPRPIAVRLIAPHLIAIAALAAALAGCATTGGLPPTQVVRYHLGDQLDRGTVAVIQPPNAAASALEFTPYQQAVQAALVANGYQPAPPGAAPMYEAIVDVHGTTAEGPRRGGFTLGLGAGGYSGGWRGGGGGGASVGIPIGGGRRPMLLTELGVTIKRRADQVAIWEGHARDAVPLRSAQAGADQQAQTLAHALFTGFPGESGRTIEVK